MIFIEGSNKYMQPSIVKQKAIDLRKKGYSYGMIREEMGLAKSTLSDWLKETPFKPNKKVAMRIGIGRVKTAIFKHNQKITEITYTKKLAKEELGELNKRDLWILGIGLYIGEGAKINESVRIINSNPDIIKAAIKWFKVILKVSDENLIPRIHLYPDIEIKNAISYWSKETGIPKKQFAKTQIDIRTNKSKRRKGKLPYGTLCLQIKSCGKKEFGRFMHRKIMGWIEHTYDQIDKI